MNPIIFKDEQGVGVSLGDKKVYITDEISDALGYNCSNILSERDKAISIANLLKERVSRLEVKNRDMSLRLKIIQAACGDDDYEV